MEVGGCPGQDWLQNLQSLVKNENAAFIIQKLLRISGTSLAVQWLRLRASTAGAMGSISGRGSKIPRAPRRGQKIKIIKNFRRTTAVH